MGREIKRVPMDFDFPIGDGYADWALDQHRAACAQCRDDEDGEGCGKSWDATKPPKGEGWQLWQTVSDGPITPVFATPEELVDFMCQPDPTGRVAQGYSPWDRGWPRDVAERFVHAAGWALSMVLSGGVLQGGAEALYGDDGVLKVSK